MPALTDPLALGPRTARNRIWFGPHETNLGRGRALSDRHVAYYRRRAEGGAGVIVTETASIHPLDWPYERAPLAVECGPGWEAIGAGCRPVGALVLASLGHAGSQGSSAYSQRELWAPSRVPDVASREVPKAMEDDDLAEVVAAFGAAAGLAARAGCDGVEVTAGQHSLLRQFVSGLTNQRGDDYGHDRLRLLREVLAAVRRAVGPGGVVALRLSCDELAPWAGITPDQAVAHVAALAPLVDALVVVRGSAMGVSATRPDGHVEPGFNLGLAARMRAAAAGATAVVAQGSIVDVGEAAAALARGQADAVEMTRALIADARLPALVAAGTPERVRPCILCNQTCMVRDARNPIVTCVGDTSSGHVTEDPLVDEGPLPPLAADVLVVGGGPAGLEVARVAAGRGARVRVLERGDRLGGALRTAAAGSGRHRLALLAEWLEAECRRLAVELVPGAEVTVEQVEGARAAGTAVVLATGGRPGLRGFTVADDAEVRTAAEVLDAVAGPGALPDGPVVVWDPIGGPIGISVAELLAPTREVTLVTPDPIAGTELARTGDLAPANVRLQQAGVVMAGRSLLRAVEAGEVVLEDRFSGVERRVPAAAVIDAGHRLPDDALWRATGAALPRAGDAVAPRTVHEAILEARRVALALTPTTTPVRVS